MIEIYKGMISGGICAKIYIDFEETGSSVQFPEHGEPYYIVKIGADFDTWTEVFDGILHEMIEVFMCNMELTYQRWYRSGCDSGDVWFHASHAEFSECISRAAQSITCFLDEAKKVFDLREEFMKSYSELASKKDADNDPSDLPPAEQS